MITEKQDGVILINSDTTTPGPKHYTPKLPEVTESLEGIPEVEEHDEVEEPAPTPVEEIKPEPSVEETAVQSSRKSHQVTQEYDINAIERLTTGEVIVVPANFDKETREVLQRMPNVKLLDNVESRNWAEDVAEGLELTTFGETFVPTLEDETADFRHKLEDSGVSLTAQSPKFKSMQNQTIKGERAVIRVISHLGLGTLFQVPLWHSGIWVTFKPPSDSEIIELNRILVSDKIKFGRYTYGLVFSNLSSYTTDRLVDFAIAHVYDLTAKAEDITVENLKQHVSSQDIPSLIWGFACTMYPRGFRYRRACVNDPEKCNYILEETLNLMKLQWTNANALTDWQKTFMAGRQSKTKDLASIQRYKEELTKLKPKKILINEGLDSEIAILIKTPTIAEYIESGYRWINDITNTVDRALGLNTTDDERNNFITRHGQASAMRQYTHWVDSIEIDTNTISDPETIETTLNVLSSDDEVRAQFIKGVVDYINSSTISVIGIPVYDCPQCNKSQDIDHKLPAHKNIIPLDVIQLFFALLGGKMENITTR